MWCLNHLVISGPADERARLRAALVDTDHMLAGGDPGALAAQGRYWYAERWGCPGDATHVRHTGDAHVDRYSFSTPQSPPVHWCALIARRYVDLELHLTWENIDDECVGTARFAGGVRTEYEEMEWIDDHEPGHIMPLSPGQTLGGASA